MSFLFFPTWDFYSHVTPVGVGFPVPVVHSSKTLKVDDVRSNWKAGQPFLITWVNVETEVEGQAETGEKDLIVLNNIDGKSETGDESRTSVFRESIFSVVDQEDIDLTGRPVVWIPECAFSEENAKSMMTVEEYLNRYKSMLATSLSQYTPYRLFTTPTHFVCPDSLENVFENLNMKHTVSFTETFESLVVVPQHQPAKSEKIHERKRAFLISPDRTTVRPVSFQDLQGSATTWVHVEKTPEAEDVTKVKEMLGISPYNLTFNLEKSDSPRQEGVVFQEQIKVRDLSGLRLTPIAPDADQEATGQGQGLRRLRDDEVIKEGQTVYRVDSTFQLVRESRNVPAPVTTHLEDKELVRKLEGDLYDLSEELRHIGTKMVVDFTVRDVADYLNKVLLVYRAYSFYTQQVELVDFRETIRNAFLRFISEFENDPGNRLFGLDESPHPAFEMIRYDSDVNKQDNVILKVRADIRTLGSRTRYDVKPIDSVTDYNTVLLEHSRLIYIYIKEATFVESYTNSLRKLFWSRFNYCNTFCAVMYKTGLQYAPAPVQPSLSESTGGSHPYDIPDSEWLKEAKQAFVDLMSKNWCVAVDVNQRELARALAELAAYARASRRGGKDAVAFPDRALGVFMDYYTREVSDLRKEESYARASTDNATCPWAVSGLSPGPSAVQVSAGGGRSGPGPQRLALALAAAAVTALCAAAGAF
jgi:hypothetical protein